MTIDHLHACPFCNGISRMHSGHADISFFACEECGAITSFRVSNERPVQYSAQEAIALYNTRPFKRRLDS